MAVCARVSVLVVYAVFAGFFQLFGEKKKYMGRAMFQGQARMISNYYFFIWHYVNYWRIRVH